MTRAHRLLAFTFAAALFATSAPAARAADPYEINVILSLTGNIAFVGATQLQALKGVEAVVNQSGGINGRPLSFVVSDDQSDAQTAVQLAHNLIAKGVPIILGPSGPAQCAGIAPLVAQGGPLLYCLTNGGEPTPGGYEFLTLMSYESQFAVTVRYFRQRGYRKMAYIVSTDAGGQGAEQAFLAAAALPENKSMRIVAREHFAPKDISVDAQMARIKAAAPDVLLAWATGPPAGALFHGMQNVGLNVPTVTAPSNLNAPFFKQYAQLIPPTLLFAAVPYYASNAPVSPATKAALTTLTNALAAENAKPDMIQISAWDPAMLLVDALRKLGTDATAPKIRAYLANLSGWTGANGNYDFRSNPQRGVGDNNVVMVRWDTQRNVGVAVSKLGGAPLP